MKFDGLHSLSCVQEYVHHADGRISQNHQVYTDEYLVYQTIDTVTSPKRACDHILPANGSSNIQSWETIQYPPYLLASFPLLCPQYVSSPAMFATK